MHLCEGDAVVMPAQLYLRTVPTNTKYFCTIYDYAGKVDLSKGYWNPKTK